MATTTSAGTIVRSKLPQWALDAIQLYESNAANQFVVYGNVNDDMVVPTTAPRLGGLTDFLLQVLLPRFDVVLSYDIGNGIRVEKGGDVFSRWPQIKENPDLPRAPRSAVETLTHYFRYTANLARLGGDRAQVGCIIKSADGTFDLTEPQPGPRFLIGHPRFGKSGVGGHVRRNAEPGKQALPRKIHLLFYRDAAFIDASSSRGGPDRRSGDRGVVEHGRHKGGGIAGRSRKYRSAPGGRLSAARACPRYPRASASRGAAVGTITPSLLAAHALSRDRD